MECNKDDAIRAKELSEKKMAENDFEGARIYALKAQKLYPALENISQLLSVCDVHCFAKKKMLGVDKDWYAILQIEQSADESTIKRQYKRLALVLHPDKNRLPGAEAAFKLISEANAVLTDTAKKSLYDNRIRAAGSVKAPPPFMNRTANVHQHFSAQAVFNNAFRNMNQQHATASSSVRQDVFWTCCAFCGRKYQYLREHVNKNLKCQTCSRNFFGCDIGSQVPSKPGLSRPVAFHQKVELNQAHSKVGVQAGKGSSLPDAGLHRFASRKSVHPEPGAKAGSSGGINAGTASNGNGDLKANETNYKHGGKSNGIPTKVTADLKNSRKRGRKMVLESSESSDSSEDSDTDEEILEAKSGVFATDNNPDTGRVQRRSSRLKQNVKYKFNESDDEDDDFASPIKRQKESRPSEDKNAANDANCSKATSKDADKVTSHSEESLPGKDAKCATNGRGGETGAAEKVEFDSDVELESGDKPDAVTLNCPDPEFHDFDKERDFNCFKINQIWACYDDGQMPRYYAKITKVNSSSFELSFKWLEVVAISEAYDKWVDAELPVGCGTFKLGRKIEKTTEINTFSHQMMHCVPGKRGVLNIYPREKEVWALFKDWDIGWSLNAEKRVEFQYEVVEVLENCLDDGAGIRVCYLDKVAGFVSLFQKSSRSELDSFWIRPEELYKFSHRVASSEALKGTERDGVPVGSFELDPASLPMNPDDLHFSSIAKKESETADPAVRFSPKHGERKGKPVKSAATVNHNSFIDLDD